MNVSSKDKLRKKREGFTLIELLVVIGIIAILSVVVVLTLNPAEMLRRGRDSNRLSDLSVFQSAMNMYTQDRAITGSSLVLGTSSVVYVSIPDPAASTSAGSDCSTLGFRAGGAYHCAGPAFFRRTDGTGWIPVNLSSITTGSPLGQLPTDPTNAYSSGEYYEYTTDGATWKMVAIPESTQYGSQFASFSSGPNQNLLGGFPNQGWVSVTGNSTFGTHNFTVMKYDAVCSDGNGNSLNDTTSADTTNYHIYDDSVASGNIPCTGSRSVAALPGGYPIADISQTTAATRCATIGAHLITNKEWQTIAWDAENVASNWAGGAVGGTGSNAMYSGHNDSSPYYALPASSDDTNGYYLTGNVASSSQRRTLTLSNGQIIWDMAGNIWQWTNDTILGTQKPVGSGGTGAWSEWTTVGSYDGTILTQQTAGPSNATWYSSHGIGQYYEGGNGGSTYGFVRGGLWADGSGDGVESLSLGDTPGNTPDIIGFRCAR